VNGATSLQEFFVAAETIGCSGSICPWCSIAVDGSLPLDSFRAGRMPATGRVGPTQTLRPDFVVADGDGLLSDQRKRVAKAPGVGVGLVALWGRTVIAISFYLCRSDRPASCAQARRARPGERGLNLGDLDDHFGKGLRRFLRQIVPDAALDGPVLVLAREFLGIGTRIRVRRAVRVTTVEADLGPVRHLATLLVKADEVVLRWFILAVVLVLDPAAVLLLLAAS
jgi:hypothetical protein